MITPLRRARMLQALWSIPGLICLYIALIVSAVAPLVMHVKVCIDHGWTMALFFGLLLSPFGWLHGLFRIFFG